MGELRVIIGGNNSLPEQLPESTPLDSTVVTWSGARNEVPGLTPEAAFLFPDLLTEETEFAQATVAARLKVIDGGLDQATAEESSALPEVPPPMLSVLPGGAQ